jgi:ribose transport system substrate-binding protein
VAFVATLETNKNFLKNMKNLSNPSIFTAIFLATVLLGSGCGQNSTDSVPSATITPTSPAQPPGGNGHVIALIAKLTNTVYWQSVLAGAKEAGKDYGYDILWNGPDRETNSAGQIEIVSNVIASQVAGVVLAPVDRTALVPSVDQLATLGIPCVIIDSGLDDVNFLSIASTDNYQGGVLAAEQLGQALGGKGNVLVVRHIAGSHATIKRLGGFSDTLAKEFPDIKIVDSESGQDTAEIAKGVATQMLANHPDVQGLFACNVDVSVGALEALQAANRNDVKMVAFDPAKSLIDGLKTGEVVAIVVQDPYNMGYQGVKVLALHSKGQSSPRVIDTGVEVVTMANITDPKIMRLLGEQQ